jgi:uncharacterized protein (DUF2384 family)
MAVSTALKAEALARELGGQAKLAGVLGVERSTVSRWLRGARPDATQAARVDALEYVLAESERVFGKSGAQKWLKGLDPRLGDRRPMDVLRSGAVHEVVRALAEHKAGAYA